MIEIGQKAPNVTLKSQDNEDFSLEALKGKWVVLYFYPKDNTPGCTTEAIDFTRFKKDFETQNALVIGVSPDSVKSHQNFCRKKDLDIILLSDPEKKCLKSYGVWQKKKMAGREYMGVVRTTYLIDPQGKVSHLWPKVKVKGHVEQVLKTLIEHKKTTTSQQE